MIPIRKITPESFAAFGTVLDFSGPAGWEIVVEEDSPGWRIALLEYGARPVTRLECHPASRESFEPVRGTGLLLTAPPEHPEKIEAFLLDCPICLFRGVWHQVVALGERAMVKITENREVTSQYVETNGAIAPGLIQNI